MAKQSRQWPENCYTSLHTADIILLVILGFGAIKGFMNGFIVEVVSFFGFFIGLILALQFTIPVTTWLFADSSYVDIIAIGVFVGLFVLLTLGLKLGAKMLKKMIDVTIFGTLDTLVGAITGVAKWGFLISMLAWIFDSVGFEVQKSFLNESVIFPYLVQIGPASFEWIGRLIPYVQDLIDSLDSIPSAKQEYLTFVY